MAVPKIMGVKALPERLNITGRAYGTVRQALVVFGAVLLTVRATPASAEEARPVAQRASLSTAVATALQQNPDALTSDSIVRGAEADRGSVGGTRYPKLHVDANVSQWNSPFNLSLGPTTLEARSAFTWSISVTVTQPLTQLWTIYDQYQVQQLGVDVAAIKRQVMRRELAFQVAQSYYGVIRADRLAEVAQASVVQLEAQQREAQALFDNGVAAKNDLLRAALALASARQRQIQAAGQIVLARGQLAALMGEPAGTAMDAEPFTGDPPGFDEPNIASAETRAAAQRPELRELARVIEQAEHGVAMAKRRLVPQVSAVGSYTHAEGSLLQQQYAAFVGLVASWDAWDWGTTTNGVSSATEKLVQARLARKKIEDQVRQEARQAYVDETVARDALGVARAAVSQAEENFRIVTKKFESAAATAFDVVDAEALLTQARGQVETGLSDLLVAHVALARATGAALPGER